MREESKISINILWPMIGREMSQLIQIESCYFTLYKVKIIIVDLMMKLKLEK